MPVYDYTYKTFEGARRGAIARWATIPRYTYMEVFSKRAFVWLFTVSWFQFVLRVGYIYLRINAEVLRTTLGIPISPGNLPAVDAAFFKNMIDVQMIFCFLFTLSIGPDLISRDLRHSALVLYMSKPIGRWEYFLGKFFSLFGLLMLITWVQTMLLFVVQYLMSPSNSEWRYAFGEKYLWITVPILLYSVTISATLSLLVLASSSLAKNARYASLGFGAYVVGTTMALAPILGEAIRVDNGMAVSPFFCGVRVGQAMFRLRENWPDISHLAAWLGIAFVWALCSLVLYWRIRNAARYGR
ncbi:hypothetical protein JW916_14105 [Candidatus Sumerlaeota bacterium]|nr:hypothetical protein [Candidatus Sumerlaeota bacterium]